MKKIISIALILVMLLGCIGALASCGDNSIIVHTNAFFAPFEYYDGTNIVGVDVEIMNMVGKELGKDIKFENVEFSAIIDNVQAGEKCDAGAAGITITDARKEKVAFSVPYYTSIQYVIVPANSTIATRTGDNGEYIVWEALEGKKIGTQLDTTGWIYTDGEINATEDNDYGYAGTLYGTNTEHKGFDNAQLAADGIASNIVDCVIIDELPAKYIVSKNSGLKCIPLYYSGETQAEDEPVQEQYAICVNKENTELLDAINKVLNSLLNDKDENGVNAIEKMVMKHMGMEK
ncbi:MAG: transporter substrate-binding domain-containing protein [Clostridia bacterium]|nr:transporter substrate-binding domain-containing protein [Clostridia bacterium]